jgi:hypothetical protein
MGMETLAILLPAGEQILGGHGSLEWRVQDTGIVIPMRELWGFYPFSLSPYEEMSIPSII